MSALAMAILLNGMTAREIARWTAAMIASGERMDFSGARPADRRQALHRRRRRQDHAAAGAAGRRLRRGRAAAVRPRPRPHRRHARQAGVDPGLAGDAVATTRCSRSCATVGAVICAAGDGLAPGRQKLYALRDVTGTVESIPLIASSIMSKKIAEGTGALVLDVKVGSGAFMKDVDRRPRAGRDDGRRSAPTHGVRTVALLTDMDTPLGRTAGNALEVARVGRGAGRRRPGRRRRADPARWPARCSPRPGSTTSTRPTRWRDGSAMDVWRRMIARAGRRPGRAAADGARDARRRRRRPPACSTRLDASRSASPPGGSAPAGPARRTRCRPARASSARQAGRRRCAAGEPLLDPAHRRPRPLRAGARGPRRRLRGRRHRRPAPAGHRPHQRLAAAVDRPAYS